MSSELEERVLVIDNRETTRVGFAGDAVPKLAFPTIVGKERHPQMMRSIKAVTKDFYVGDEVLQRKGLLTIKHPIECGIITNWDDIEKLWQYSFHDVLGVNPKEHPVLVTETSPLNPKVSREKITQVMFECFNVPAMYSACQAVLALYSTGRTTGVVLDSGYDVTHTVPIYEGHALPHAVPHMFVAGRDMTDLFHKMLNEKYLWVSNAPDLRIAFREMMEKVCYVALDYKQEMAIGVEKTYNFEYADEQLTLGNECFQCPEVLFKPDLVGINSDGVHKTLELSIKKCDADIQKDLYSNVLISGDNMMYSGMAERLQKELTALAPPTEMVNVVSSPDSKSAAWLGGSMLASSPSFKDMCISKQEYDEFGPGIIFKKCF